MSWVDVTNTFSESERHYKNMYLEICEVYDGVLEVNLFRNDDDLDEIYFSYGIFYGIIYVESDEAIALREEIKEELEKEYSINKEVTDEFISNFGKKYEVCLPDDLFFDFNLF